MESMNMIIRKLVWMIEWNSLTNISHHCPRRKKQNEECVTFKKVLADNLPELVNGTDSDTESKTYSKQDNENINRDLINTQKVVGV